VTTRWRTPRTSIRTSLSSADSRAVHTARIHLGYASKARANAFLLRCPWPFFMHFSMRPGMSDGNQSAANDMADVRYASTRVVVGLLLRVLMKRGLSSPMWVNQISLKNPTWIVHRKTISVFSEMDVDKLNVYLGISFYILSIKTPMTSLSCGPAAQVAGIQNHDERKRSSCVPRGVNRRPCRGRPSPLVTRRTSGRGPQELSQSSFSSLVLSSLFCLPLSFSFVFSGVSAGTTLPQGGGKVVNNRCFNSQTVIFS